MTCFGTEFLNSKFCMQVLLNDDSLYYPDDKIRHTDSERRRRSQSPELRRLGRGDSSDDEDEQSGDENEEEFRSLEESQFGMD